MKDSRIEEIKVYHTGDNVIQNGSFEDAAATEDLISNGDFSTWSFDSGTIASFYDYSGVVPGTVAALDVGHGLSTNDIIEIRTGDYAGSHVITKINDNGFYFTAVFNNPDGSDWVRIRTLPTDWSGAAMDERDYAVQLVGGTGMKIYADNGTFYIYQEEVYLDEEDRGTVNYVIDIESITSGGLILKNGTTTIETFTTAGIHTGTFEVDDGPDLYLYVSAGTYMVLNSITSFKNNLFDEWDTFNDIGDSSVEEIVGYVGDKAAKLNTGTSYIPRLGQRITGANLASILGKVIVFGFAYKSNYATGRILIYIDGVGYSEYFDIHNTDSWNYYYIEKKIVSTASSVEIRLVGAEASDSYACYDDTKLYTIEEETLEKELIYSIDNIKNEIEDDLFTFKADDISLVMENESNAGYMNPMDFITESNLYAIKIKYNNGTVLSPSYKYQYLFTNWDNCSRKQDKTKDLITLSFFELTGLFSDMNWYLGRYISDPESSEVGIYKFDTDKPLILDKNSSLNTSGDTEDLLNDRLLPVLKSLIVQNNIPIYPYNINLEIEDNLLSSNGIINHIDLISFVESGKKRLLDYFIDTNTYRLFILTIDNTYDNGDNPNGEYVELYEITNSTTSIFIDSFELQEDASGFLDVAFIHRWDTDTSRAGSILIVMQNARGATTTLIRAVGYKYDDSNSLVRNTYQTKNDETLGTLDQWAKAYVDNTGTVVENGTIINSNWILTNLSFSILDISNYYTINGIQTYDNNDIGEYRIMTWCANMTFNTTYFPKYLHLFGSSAFNDSTLAAIMKEICVTQDALWYFKYTSSNGITLYIRRRASISGESTTEIDDESETSDIKTIDTKLSIVTFDDITSSIYANDPYRTKLFRDWYNSKYGGGKKIKSLTMFDIINLILGDVIYFSSEGVGTKYMIKYLEWSEEDVETTCEVFELGEDT